jgi:hypothetical protein
MGCRFDGADFGVRAECAICTCEAKLATGGSGRAWLDHASGKWCHVEIRLAGDRVTGAWQQIEIALSNFGTQGTMIPALEELIGTELDGVAGEVLSIVPMEANFELRVSAVPDAL